MTTATVLIFRGVKTQYSYINPSASYKIGDHVLVPFGNYDCIGLIVDTSSKTKTSRHYKLKEIKERYDKLPNIPEDLINLISWFQHYYQTTPYKAYQTVIGNRKHRDVQEEPPENTAPQTEPTLTPEQNSVLESIFSAKGYATFLVHGITSSGKTEIYIQVSKHMIAQGKQAIICLPEIALTPQFTKVFEERFGKRLAVVHSGLTPKQREVAWNKINNGHVSIVIGPRSAIFSPLKNIGTIIIDEEHETTYKQDQHPRYYTHTVAEYRAKKHQATLILGSATPAIDSYSAHEKANKKDEPETILRLKKRIYNRPLPQIQLVDMKEQIALHNEYFLSLPLQEALNKSLKNKEKTIILVNRRGFSTHIMCQSCGATCECPNCKLSLTYHKDKTLRCHRCDLIKPMTHTCPSCKREKLQYGGTGIQKIEMELKRHFSEASIIRLDRDEAKTAKQVHKKLAEFKESGDILIGTQMIAKGHHIESVTTVGVIGIDSTLNIPDFRSAERTFQLITQVAGRAGRGEKPGQVIVQTTQPTHYAITHASQHDFCKFYDQEIQFRKELWYPPFSSLINILFSSLDEVPLKKYIQKAFHELQHQLKSVNEEIQYIGPKPAPIEKINGYFRWNLLLKCHNDILETVKESLRFLNSHPKQVRVIIDLDPRSIL